ncbi:zinc finger, CCHC-type containing protein [Tanacetum coccineum]
MSLGKIPLKDKTIEAKSVEKSNSKGPCVYRLFPSDMSLGKILPPWHQFLDQKIRGAHFSLGIVAGERFAIELTPSTFPQRHFAGDMFPQRHVAGEKVGMLLGKASNVVVQDLINKSLIFSCNDLQVVYTFFIYSLCRKDITTGRSMTWSLTDDAQPFVAMLMITCSDMSVLTLVKAAMNAGMESIVYIVYHNALGTMILLPFFVAHMFRNSTGRPPLSFHLLFRFFILGLLGICLFQTATAREYPDQDTIVFLYCLFGTIAYITIAHFLEPNPSAWVLQPGIEMIAIVCRGIYSCVFRSTAATWCLKKKGPIFVIMFMPLSIVITVIMGVTFLSDSLHLGSAIGAAIIYVGFYSVVWGQAKEKNNLMICGGGRFKWTRTHNYLIDKLLTQHRVPFVGDFSVIRPFVVMDLLETNEVSCSARKQVREVWRIIHETTGPYTPQQNSVAERKNRALKEMVNSMLSYSDLSEGNDPTCHICELAVVRLPDPKRKILGEKGIDCIFVGYAENSKVYKFYVIEPNESVSINSIVESIDAIFDENRFSSIPRSKDIIPNSVESQRDDHSDDVPSEIPKPRKGKRVQKAKSYSSNFQLYLVEGLRDHVGSQYSYCYSIEEDPRTYDEAMQSRDVAF